MSFIMYYIVNPSASSVRHDSKKLKDIEFPLDFSICFNDYESNRYKNMDIFMIKDYFEGIVLLMKQLLAGMGT